MTTTAARPVIKLAGPADLVAAVPYLLGFTPADSVVAVHFAGKSLGFTARLDLIEDPISGAAGLRAVGQAAERAEADHVRLVAYESEEGAADVTVDALVAYYGSLGICVCERMTVRDGLWFDEHGIAYPIGSDAVEAEFAFAGVAPQSSREAVRAEFAARPVDGIVEALSKAAAEYPDVDAALESWARLLTFDVHDVDDIARAVFALGDKDLRDALAAHLHPEPVDGADEALMARVAAAGVPTTAGADNEVTHLIAERLTAVARSVPESAAPAPLSVAAHLWLGIGDGARAAFACEAALAADETYTLARLLLSAIACGIRSI